MGTKNIQVIVLLLLSLSCMQFQCERRFDCAETRYSFEMGIRAYPDHEQIRLGDTIWFEIKEPVLLKNYPDGEIVNYKGAANLGSAISFHKVLDTQFVSAADNFDYILSKGILVGSLRPEYLKDYLFIEENGYYVFKLGIEPKQTGTYSILFSRAANVYRQNDQCTKAAFSLNFEDTDQHYHLHPYYQGGTFKGGDYYFEVK